MSPSTHYRTDSKGLRTSRPLVPTDQLERIKPPQRTPNNGNLVSPLPTAFSKSGRHHRQIFREGLVAVYARSKPGGIGPHYEVIRINQNEAREAFGKMLEASESYPHENRWGVDGFTLLDKSSALERAKAWVVKENSVD